ncbi:uncharacterized protein BT62DRAFT_1000807 [Guyanagaster necrorhizus]|uniref:Uncharacterized protein n=1 Tax=Guyanagaster necrorhizus TaxID=856835 RepID=A0A9P7W3L0_9AGAR|nr:uncharacterized protein BT62DRAFT_1000807 [Guyanagaster necrorhizus MCA 3950]KAG7451553.1 hypothetical protein BT62DRAFT_1000807 [Guyanagaster necrorhizus MCA 3950]
MLIRLLPPASHPTVLFAITFQNLPGDLFNPHAWTSHLSNLSVDGVDTPELVHCLDKAAFIPSILKEVTFDVPMLMISCRFVDGSTEEWPLRAARCLLALDSVLDDVNHSAVLTEREKEREKVKEKERKDGLQSLNSPPTTVKVTRHKKQRSLLMSLVASFVQLPSPLSSHAHSMSEPITRLPSLLPSKPSPSPNPEPATISSPPTLTPKALRRRARSTLVDTFRMYVVGELNRRLPSGGYYPWILRSMLRRASDTMADLLQQAAETNSAFVTSSFQDEGYFPPSCLVTSPFSSDEDDADTDGSSVHTPSTAYFSLRSMHRYSHAPETPTDYTSVPRHLQGLSSDELLEYQSLSSHCIRLRQLLILQEAKEEHLANEVRQRDAVLEIRSRRRAWQNKALVARVGDMNVGLATPYASSRLAQVSWSGEDYEYSSPSYDSIVEEDYVKQYREYDEKLVLGLKRTKGRSDAKLFPVREEDEEEPCDAQEYELELGLDGLDDVDAALRAWKIEDEDDYEEGFINYAGIGKASIHPRIRTNSMHVNRLGARPNVNVESLPRHSSTLSATSLLCQPLKIGRPPSYSKMDISGLASGGYKRLLGDRFTLSMDVPLRMQAKEQDLLMKRRHSSILTMDADSERGWLSPRFTEEVIAS